jgi:hypothetical protein
MDALIEIFGGFVCEFLAAVLEWGVGHLFHQD